MYIEIGNKRVEKRQKNKCEQEKRNARFLLAIDTCCGRCSVTIARLNVLNLDFIDQVVENQENRQAERLMEMIKLLLSLHNIAIQDLECVALTVGPGSFTGTRIGIAAVYGLYISLKQLLGKDSIQIIPVSTFDAMLGNYFLKQSLFTTNVAHTILYAGNLKYYYKKYLFQNNSLSNLIYNESDAVLIDSTDLNILIRSIVKEALEQQEQQQNVINEQEIITKNETRESSSVLLYGDRCLDAEENMKMIKEYEIARYHLDYEKEKKEQEKKESKKVFYNVMPSSHGVALIAANKIMHSNSNNRGEYNNRSAESSQDVTKNTKKNLQRKMREFRSNDTTFDCVKPYYLSGNNCYKDIG